MKIARSRSGCVYLALGIAVLAILCVPGASLYYEASGGRACARCHEIWQPYIDWHASAHRNIKCTECHGNVFTVDAEFHLNNMRRVFTHLRGDAPEQVRIREGDIPKIIANCQRCHQQEYADWQAGPHSVSYRDIFLDKTFNQKNLLMDDCLRCHGMHFGGPIRELVQPIATTGPWSLKDHSLADHPVIPCLTCHEIHKEGVPLQKSRLGVRTPGPGQEIMLPSLALFDRREMESIPVNRLSLPEIKDGSRLVKISSDPRQALCYECHAPRATQQVGSGDDRTPIGVHEGLSCFGCHLKHGQLTRASCATCHPRLSNCGLDVEKMDTTFKSPKSPHDIHFVKCEDCHTKGVPKKARREVHFPTSANASIKSLQ
jgi:decaheme cytochrome c component MtrC/MtrF-like protein